MRKLVKASILVMGMSLPCFLVGQAPVESTRPAHKRFRVDLSSTVLPSSILQWTTSTTNANNDAFQLQQSSSFGPIGGRFEYFFRPNWSVGLDVFYNQRQSTGSVVFAENGQSASATYIVNRLRIQTRFAYQFQLVNPDLDIYVGVGVGSNTRYRSLYVDGSLRDKSDLPIAVTIPFSLRAFSGIRYTFFHNFGVHAEFGIGGPVMSAGISYKW